MTLTTIACDIEGSHSGDISIHKVPVMFDHDQEDGRSRCEPYFETHTLDMCATHFDEMIKKRMLIYAYGAMGFNKYYLEELCPLKMYDKS